MFRTAFEAELGSERLAMVVPGVGGRGVLKQLDGGAAVGVAARVAIRHNEALFPRKLSVTFLLQLNPESVSLNRRISRLSNQSYQEQKL